MGWGREVAGTYKTRAGLTWIWKAKLGYRVRLPHPLPNKEKTSKEQRGKG